MADGTQAATATFVPDATQARAFRDALGQFASGATMISAMGPDGATGFIASSFASVSLDPPLVLWSIARVALRYPVYAAARHYAIHVLAEDQVDLIARFARGGPGFDGLEHAPNAEGVPVLAGALARFDCERHETHDGGDHRIIVGRVLRVATRKGTPLAFWAGRQRAFMPTA